MPVMDKLSNAQNHIFRFSPILFKNTPCICISFDSFHITVSHLHTTTQLSMYLISFLIFNFTGGMGGKFGYHRFIVTGENMTDFPKTIRRNGFDGSIGRNERTCRTRGLRVHTDSLYRSSIFPLSKGAVIETDFSAEIINDDRCTDHSVVTIDLTEKPKPSKHMCEALATDEYKKMLLENMKNPVLTNSIQNAYKAINTNLEINRNTQ